MKWPTHQIGGVLFGLGASGVAGLSVDEAIAFTVGAFAASIAPDVDATMRLRKRYDHKSLPHSLVFGGLGSVILAFVVYSWLAANAPSTYNDPIPAGTVALLAPGAAVGYLSHLALDAMNPSGIWLFMPKGIRIGLPRKRTIRTGSFKELLVSVVMLVGCVLLTGPVLGIPVAGVLS